MNSLYHNVQTTHKCSNYVKKKCNLLILNMLESLRLQTVTIYIMALLQSKFHRV